MRQRPSGFYFADDVFRFIFVGENCSIVIQFPLTVVLMDLLHNMTAYIPEPWWRHQMETISALLVLCAGDHRSPVNSPHKGPVMRILMFSLVCTWTNGWVNNRGAGHFKPHRAHLDVCVNNRWEKSLSELSIWGNTCIKNIPGQLRPIGTQSTQLSIVPNMAEIVWHQPLANT